MMNLSKTDKDLRITNEVDLGVKGIPGPLSSSLKADTNSAKS